MLLGWGQGPPSLSMWSLEQNWFSIDKGEGAWLLGRQPAVSAMDVHSVYLQGHWGLERWSGTLKVRQPVVTTQFTLFLWHHAEICHIRVGIARAFLSGNKIPLPCPSPLRLPHSGWSGRERPHYALVIFSSCPAPKPHLIFHFSSFHPSDPWDATLIQFQVLR